MSLGLLVAALLLLNSSANSQVTVPLNDTQPFTDSLLQNSVNHYFFERTSISLNDLLPASQLTPSTQTSTFVSTSVQSNSVSSPSSAARQPSTINASASSGKHHGTGKHNKRAGSIDPSGTWNLFVTLTTCSQPVGGSGSPGPLQLFVSTNARNTLPGPSAPSDAQTSGDPSKGNGTLAGFLDVTMLSLSLAQIKNVWIGVSAPQLQGQGWTGNWTYQLGVSTKAPMHVVLPPQTPPPIALDDTDITSALFLTRNYTDTSSPNWKLVITTDGPPTALSLSLCAAERYQVLLTPNVTITKRGPMLGNKQQAYVKGLVPGKNYSAYYVISNQAGVGSISQPVKFRTKTVANCRLIYNLQFCDQVAYSVPAPVPLDPITLDLNNLTVSYDQQAKNIFKPFEVAINQFDCSSTRYSLTHNCSDCLSDYKRWLCAVTIPRCTDAPIDVGLRPVPDNTSRNPWIDATLSPGGWIELLPCIDLCYYVVQSCPPFVNFACPQPQVQDLARQQYGYWNDGENSSVLDRPTCNSLGVDFSVKAALSGAESGRSWLGGRVGEGVWVLMVTLLMIGSVESVTVVFSK